MKNSTTPPDTCTSTMKLLGDYWTLRIIDCLRLGATRFCELQRSVDNVNPVTLTSRLKKLEEAKLIRRTVDPSGKIAVSYSLTNLGMEVLPVISALNNFSVKSKTVS